MAIREIESANSWEVGMCAEGHTFVLLHDDRGRAFAEAHIGDEEDVDHLVFALLTGDNGPWCYNGLIETLEELLAKVRSDLASAKAKAVPTAAQDPPQNANRVGWFRSQVQGHSVSSR